MLASKQIGCAHSLLGSYERVGEYLKHADNDAEKIHEMSDEEADDLGNARSSRAHI